MKRLVALPVCALVLVGCAAPAPTPSLAAPDPVAPSAADRLPDLLEPGQRASGVVVLDSRHDRGWVSTVLLPDSPADMWWPVGG